MWSEHGTSVIKLLHKNYVDSAVKSEEEKQERKVSACKCLLNIYGGNYLSEMFLFSIFRYVKDMTQLRDPSRMRFPLNFLKEQRREHQDFTENEKR